MTQAITDLNYLKSWLQERPFALLATQNRKSDFPYLSAVEGYWKDLSFYTLVSGLAEHTKNLEKNPKAALFFSTIEKPPIGTSARTSIEVLAECQERPPEVVEELVSRYPWNKDYLVLKDFKVWSFTALRARSIQGFGHMNWVTFEE